MRIENSFIPVDGIGEKIESRIWRNGIRSWEEFDGSCVGPKREERIYDYIETARRELKRENSEFFAETFPRSSTWRMFGNFSDQACYLDIETTGLSKRDSITCISFYSRDSDPLTLVQGQDLTPERVINELESANLLITFNGKTFDIPVIESQLGIEVTQPHMDLRYVCDRVGLSGGLKDIEYTLGLSRDLPDIDGREAIRLWEKYQRGREEALEQLVRYNQEDVTILEEIAETVIPGLHQQVFERNLPD